MLFSPQIPLPLEPLRDGGFDGYVPGPNEAVVAAIRHFAQDEAVSLYLGGAESSGKTHLLNALCRAARDAGGTAFYLGLRRMPEGSESTLEGLEEFGLICVDDLDAVAGQSSWEIALFNLYNRLRDTGGRLVVSSRATLAALPFALPDLRSRLGSGLRLALQPLDEEDKLKVLQRHADALGVELPEEVGRYLLSRGHRSLAWLVGVVERLQQAAFIAKRRITIPLAREVIGS